MIVISTYDRIRENPSFKKCTHHFWLLCEKRKSSPVQRYWELTGLKKKTALSCLEIEKETHSRRGASRGEGTNQDAAGGAAQREERSRIARDVYGCSEGGQLDVWVLRRAGAAGRQRNCKVTVDSLKLALVLTAWFQIIVVPVKQFSTFCGSVYCIRLVAKVTFLPILLLGR